MLDHFRVDGVPLDIATAFQKIVIVCYQETAKSVLKHMANVLILARNILCVAKKQSLRNFAKGFRVLKAHQQVNMIGHEAVMIDVKPELGLQQSEIEQKL